MLKKSFWSDDQNFSGLLMRFARGDMRDHIVSHKNDHGASYDRYGVLQWWSRLKLSFARFSGSFSFRLLQHYRPKACMNRYYRRADRLSSATCNAEGNAVTTFRSGWTNDTRFSCPLSSLDTRALPVSILCGDPKFPPSQHAGAIPPGSLSVPTQEHFGF